MKFIHSLTQTRLFKPPPYYQLLCSREEQDPEFWREIAVAFVKEKHNIETSQNRFPISIYQEGPPYKPYFIAVNNWGQAIIGPTKKIVATHIVRKLKILIWFMWIWKLKRKYCYGQYLMSLT